MSALFLLPVHSDSLLELQYDALELDFVRRALTSGLSVNSYMSKYVYSYFEQKILTKLTKIIFNDNHYKPYAD